MSFLPKIESLLFDVRLWPPERWLVIYAVRRWIAGGEASRSEKRAFALIEEQRRFLVALEKSVGSSLELEPIRQSQTKVCAGEPLNWSYSDILLAISFSHVPGSSGW